MNFIEDGNIPFLYYKENIQNNNRYTIKENLKWGVESDVITYRNLFLKQLLMMVIIEAEAIGFENLEIRWSYPKAFTSLQYSILTSFWNNILKELELNQ